MFGNLGAMKQMGAIAGLLQNKEKVKEAGDRIRRSIDATRAEGVGGGGACRAVATGDLKIESVTLDPAMASGLAADPAQAEAVIAEAVNDALARAKDQTRATLQAEAKELGLDGLLGDAIANLGEPGKGIDSFGKLLG